jgi:hypothetical protein
VSTTERAVKKYLSRVDRALREAGADRRKEIVEEIATHIREELSQIDGEPTEAQVDDVLAQVGDPDEIAAQEGGNHPAVPFPFRGIAALVLLLAGGLLFFPVGWLVGVVLLWSCDRWEVRDKILGTALVPLGLALPIYVWIAGCGTSNPVRGEGGGTDYVCDWFGIRRTWMIAFVVVLALVALGTSAFLAGRLRNPNATGYFSRSVVTSPFILVLAAVFAIGYFATTETLLHGAGKEGEWKVVASWRFQYCLLYKHALGEGGACGLTQSESVSNTYDGRGLKVFRVDAPYSAFSGVVPRGVERIDLVTESGRHIHTEFSRVLNMTFYAGLVPGTPKVDVVAFDDDGNVINQ